MARQLVGAGRQGGMPRQRPVLRRVHVRLPVLDAHAHGEGLLLHGKPRAIQHFKGIPRAVSQRQHHLPGGQIVYHAVLPHRHAAHRAVLRAEALQPRAEADVRPGLGQLPAQAAQGDVQHVRAHMGSGVREDALRRAAAHQRLHNEPVAHVTGAGVQLPVGKRTGAALAELDVAFGVQRAAAPEALHVRLPLFYRAASL